MHYTNPTSVRLSDHFLLSDLLGCHSVYSKGYPNLFEDADGTRTREGITLCEKVLEPLLQYSRLSISYGYISPELSERIVKYQDPKKPSYHRWDAGAACDVTLHDALIEGEPPIHSAFWIDENLPVSRVITYSESACICVASRYEEVQSGDHRRALYENRYMGERKPKYISYSSSPSTRRRQKEEAELPHGWIGEGYPTYHGGGIKQVQHIRTSEFTLLSDFLFSAEAVRHGYANVPTQRTMPAYRSAGSFYDGLIALVGVRRLSIIRAYESPQWSSDPRFSGQREVHLWLVPPDGVPAGRVAEAALTLDGVVSAGAHADVATIAVRVGYERAKEVQTQSSTQS